VTSPELDRSVSFYSDLFGWKAQADSRPEAGGYTMFSLRGKHVAAASPPPPGQESVPSHWTTYLASDDVDETASRVREAGGTLFLEPFDVFDAGRMTVAQDPTGAVFGVWQAGEHIGAELANEPGTLNWNECRTTDPETAATFYEQVFGYEIDVQSIGEGQEYRVIKVGGRGVGGVAELGPRLQRMPPHRLHRRRHRQDRRPCRRPRRRAARGARRHSRRRPIRRASRPRRRRLRRPLAGVVLTSRRERTGS